MGRVVIVLLPGAVGLFQVFISSSRGKLEVGGSSTLPMGMLALAVLAAVSKLSCRPPGLYRSEVCDDFPVSSAFR